MRFVTASTVPVDRIVHQPAGTIVYVELEHGAPVSRAQSYLAGRARTAGVSLKTRTLLLVDPDNQVVTKILRVEVGDEKPVQP